MAQLRWMRIDQAAIVDCRLRRQLFYCGIMHRKEIESPLLPSVPYPRHPRCCNWLWNCATQTRQINKYKMLKCRYKMHSEKCKKLYKIWAREREREKKAKKKAGKLKSSKLKTTKWKLKTALYANCQQSFRHRNAQGGREEEVGGWVGYWVLKGLRVQQRQQLKLISERASCFLLPLPLLFSSFCAFSIIF